MLNIIKQNRYQLLLIFIMVAIWIAYPFLQGYSIHELIDVFNFLIGTPLKINPMLYTLYMVILFINLRLCITFAIRLILNTNYGSTVAIIITLSILLIVMGLLNPSLQKIPCSMLEHGRNLFLASIVTTWALISDTYKELSNLLKENK